MNPIYESEDYAAFIAGIREMTEDDIPRLALSDWLEERGEVERAEFIRLQVELTRIDRTVDASDWGILGQEPPQAQLDWRAMKKREGELADRDLSEWFGFDSLLMHGTKDGDLDSFGVRRGFLETLRIRGRDWIRHADAILRLNPVREVTWLCSHDAPLIAPGMTTSFPIWPGVKFTFEWEGYSVLDLARRMMQSNTDGSGVNMEEEILRRFRETAASMQPAIDAAGEAMRQIGEALAPAVKVVNELAAALAEDDRARFLPNLRETTARAVRLILEHSAREARQLV